MCVKRRRRRRGDGLLAEYLSYVRAIWAIHVHDIRSSSINLTVFQRVQLTHRRWTPCILASAICARRLLAITFEEQSFCSRAHPAPRHIQRVSVCVCALYFLYKLSWFRIIFVIQLSRIWVVDKAHRTSVIGHLTTIEPIRNRVVQCDAGTPTKVLHGFSLPCYFFCVRFRLCL